MDTSPRHPSGMLASNLPPRQQRALLLPLLGVQVPFAEVYMLRFWLELHQDSPTVETVEKHLF